MHCSGLMRGVQRPRDMAATSDRCVAATTWPCAWPPQSSRTWRPHRSLVAASSSSDIHSGDSWNHSCCSTSLDYHTADCTSAVHRLQIGDRLYNIHWHVPGSWLAKLHKMHAVIKSQNPASSVCKRDHLKGTSSFQMNVPQDSAEAPSVQQVYSMIVVPASE